MTKGQRDWVIVSTAVAILATQAAGLVPERPDLVLAAVGLLGVPLALRSDEHRRNDDQ